jgi:hypothetical protein
MVKLLANFFVQYYSVPMQGRLQNVFLFLALAAVCLPSPAAATAFSLDCTIGFNGYFQLNHWSPLNVVIENRGRAVHGKLEVVVTSGSEYLGDVYRTVYATDADLPPDSVKRYQFTVTIKSFTHDLAIRLQQNNRIIFAKSVDLRSHFTEKGLAVVADDFVAPDILSVLPNQLHSVNVRPKFLPETWYGYDSVKLLIMGAGSVRQLAERQYQALRRWLRQGGYLVIAGGVNYGSLGEKRIQDLLPLRINGYQRMHSLKSLALFCGRPLAAVDPFLILDAGIDDSTILLKENDIPIVTRKDFGFGRIVFLSVDVNAPPFSRWEGRPMFWDRILSLAPPAAGPALELDDQKILDSMLVGMPLKFPAFKWGVIFVAGYLIFLKLVLKKIGKPGRMRWRYSLGLLVMIIIFSVIGYRLYYYPNLSRKLTYNTFCQLEVSGPDVPAFANVFIGLYSLQKSSYGLDFGTEANPVSHILSTRARSKVPAPYALWLNDRGQQIVGALNRRSHNFYRMQLRFDSPLAGSALQDDSFLTLKVENKLPRNLIDCLVYYKRRFVFVEDIPANTRQVLKLSLAELKATEIFNDQEMQKIIRQLDSRSGAGFLRSARMNLTKDLILEIHKKYRSKADSMILIGWMPAGLFQPEFTPSGPTGTGLTLVCWQLPVERVS